MAARTSRSDIALRRTTGGAATPMGRALVLNATYEPIGVVSARRGVLLVLSDKADAIHSEQAVWNSERMSMASPSVVRLRQYVELPYRRRAPLHRRTLFARDHFSCQYCGATAECIDHVHPRSRGGTHVWENVVACCRRCNLAKSDKLLSEAPQFVLRRRPVAPSMQAWIVLAAGRVPMSWRDYLPDVEPALLDALAERDDLVGLAPTG